MSQSPSSSTEDNSSLDSDFTYFYQKFHFQESEDDKVTVAQALRMQLLLNNLQSKKYNDRGATNFLLRRDLDKYVTTIDDQSKLNNYAEYINNMCRKSLKPPRDCSKWKSNLKNNDSIKSFVLDLGLNKKSADEDKIDRYLLQKLVSKLRDIDRASCEELVRKQTPPTLNDQTLSPNKNENKFSACQPHTSHHQNVRDFHPARNILSTITSQNVKNPMNKCIGANNQVNSSKYPVNKVNNKVNQNIHQGRAFNDFKTARTELVLQNSKKYGNNPEGSLKKSLGGRSRSVNSKFHPPIKTPSSDKDLECETVPFSGDERLKGLDPKLIELIQNEIMDRGNPITWDDISGLEFAKKTIQEIVIWPLLRPDIFTGLRKPPKGILLFGPPGTGKTLIGKCIASQSSSTFFSISASSLVSKWLGESEKLVRTLFAVARCHQPAVIFIDEIDSMLGQRKESEHESSRRIKTEFLVQLDGASTQEDDRILVIGATNLPQELDEAARRRLVKRLYIPLPEFNARKHIVQRVMSAEKAELTVEDIDKIAELTEGYSGADMKNLCQEASLGPIRSIDFRLISSIESQEVRPITFDDFKAALTVVRSSVSPSDLNQYLEWDKIYGSRGT